MVVWDEEGWRIELPDLRGKWWWERWLAHGSTVEEGRLKFSLADAMARNCIPLKPRALEIVEVGDETARGD